MRNFLAATAAVLALAGTTTLVASPAEARWHGGYGGYGGWHGGYHHGGGAGLAVGAGILGLAAGAAIASRPYYGGYARPYYGGYGGYGYYAPPPPPVYYGYGYGYRPCGRWAAWHGYC